MDDATREWLEQIRAWHKGGEYGCAVAPDIGVLLDALADAEAERDQAVKIRDVWMHSAIADQQRATAAEAARDQAVADYRELFAEIQEEREETTRVMIGWQHKAEAAEAARAQARAEAVEALTAHGLAVESLRHVEALSRIEMRAAELHATRLATLAAAARAWARWMEADQTGEDWADVAERLRAAVAALDAPSPR